jgi:molybdate transport system substrate-binding protein
VGTDIKVIKTLGTAEAYRDLLPAFERATGHRVETAYGGTVDVKKRIAGGEAFDLVIMASEAIDGFIASGQVATGSRTDIAASGVGIAVAAGAPKPDISSADTFKAALIAARTIGYSTGPSGDYFVELLKRMGLSDQMAAKLCRVPPGGFVGTLIANGEAELGIQQVSELSTFAGITYVGPLPPELQKRTIFAGGISAQAGQPDAARDLVSFLTASDADDAFRKHGMERA